MKKKYIAIIAIAVIAIVVVLVVLNPFNSGNNAAQPDGNSTEPTNGNSNNYIKPTGSTGISPGKVLIENCVLGEPEEHKLQIYNGGNNTAIFSVDYRHPDHVEEGYTRLSSDIRQWIKIGETRPSINSGEVYTVTIRLTVPSTAEIPGGKFEFWIGVIDKSQTGMVISELAQRWLVTVS